MEDVKTLVEIGGIKQRIHYISSNPDNPVLLFLHGGPGISNRHVIVTNHRDLTDKFIIVTWDQRGTGGSFYGIKHNSLTIKDFIEDTSQLIEWCCKKIYKDKIFIIGGSWGSELGIWVSKLHPERIAAFFGFGQVVDIPKNEEISFNFTRNAALEAGNMDDVAKLDKVGPPVNGQYIGGLKGMLVQRNLMMKYGGYSQKEGKKSYLSAMVIPILKSGEYNLRDLYGLIFGYKNVLQALWPELGETCFPKTCTVFEVPIFIFDGRKDMNTPSELVEDWYNMIQAPYKELVWFEESGHNPLEDEPYKFKKMLVERCLKIKTENPLIRI